MTAPSEEKPMCDKFNLEALTVNQVKSFKALADGKDVFIGTKTGSAALHSQNDIKCLSLVEDHPDFPKNVCKNLLFLPESIFGSQGLPFGSRFSPPLADLEYILRIRALIFHYQ
jgi:hypothetical protein